DADRRRSQPPAEVQRFPAFLGQPVPVVSPLELASTPLSAAHLGGGQPVPIRAASSLPVEGGAPSGRGGRSVYGYSGLGDRIPDQRGLGPFYDAELRAADRLVADVLEQLPPGAALLVTADHGQVSVGQNILQPSAALLGLVA